MGKFKVVSKKWKVEREKFGLCPTKSSGFKSFSRAKILNEANNNISKFL